MVTVQAQVLLMLQSSHLCLLLSESFSNTAYKKKKSHQHHHEKNLTFYTFKWFSSNMFPIQVQNLAETIKIYLIYITSQVICTIMVMFCHVKTRQRAANNNMTNRGRYCTEYKVILRTPHWIRCLCARVFYRLSISAKGGLVSNRGQNAPWLILNNAMFNLVCC